MIYDLNFTNRLKDLVKKVDDTEYDYAMEGKTCFVLYRKGNKEKNLKIKTFRIEKELINFEREK